MTEDIWKDPEPRRLFVPLLQAADVIGARMLAGLAATGHATLWFKPHDSEPYSVSRYIWAAHKSGLARILRERIASHSIPHYSGGAGMPYMTGGIHTQPGTLLMEAKELAWLIALQSKTRDSKEHAVASNTTPGAVLPHNRTTQEIENSILAELRKLDPGFGKDSAYQRIRKIFPELEEHGLRNLVRSLIEDPNKKLAHLKSPRGRKAAPR